MHTFCHQSPGSAALIAVSHPLFDISVGLPLHSHREFSRPSSESMPLNVNVKCEQLVISLHIRLPSATPPPTLACVYKSNDCLATGKEEGVLQRRQCLSVNRRPSYSSRLRSLAFYKFIKGIRSSKKLFLDCVSPD